MTTTKQYFVNGVEFKAGDKVRIEREVKDNAADGMGSGVKWRNVWTSEMTKNIGKEFVIDNINDNGAYFKDHAWLGYPLTALTKLTEPKFKVGDTVICTNDDNYSDVQKDKTYTVERVSRSGAYLKFKGVYYDGYDAVNFELAAAAPAPKKLKLPLTVNRAFSTNVVVTAGTKPGMVTLVYALDGDVHDNTMTEEEVIDKLENGIWSLIGQSGEQVDKEAAIAAAKEKIAAAQAELATAEAIVVSKPYLV